MSRETLGTFLGVHEGSAEDGDDAVQLEPAQLMLLVVLEQIVPPPRVVGVVDSLQDNLAHLEHAQELVIALDPFNGTNGQRDEDCTSFLLRKAAEINSDAVHYGL